MLQSMGHKESETTERLNNFWLCCDLAAVCVHSLAEVSGLLIEAASLVQEHRLSSQRARVYLLFGTLYVPRLGIQPKPLHWKHRVLTTGPPGKSPDQPTLPVLRLLLTEVDREIDGERVFL